MENESFFAMTTCIFVFFCYRCGNGKCVSVSVLCDHHDDCSDSSDEDCCTLVNILIF